MIKYLFQLLFLVTVASGCQNQATTPVASDNLSLWNDSEVKSAIINFVEKVTDENSPDFVPVEERIATLDNDGTLWTEKPIYTPLYYEIEHIQNGYSNKPEWKDDELYTALAENNLAILKEYDSFQLINKLFAAHDGQKEEEYKKEVYNFLTNELHPKLDRPFKSMTFSPMVQLVDFLHKNNFKVYIVSGGEMTFVRTVSEEIYNIPPENVIGSSVKLKYVSDNTGGYLIRTAEINSANDKHVKPTNIELYIGQKPIFAAGNSDGDYEMMEYTLSGDGPSMAILVHHDDEEREYSYIHGTEKAVEDAKEQGWYVISMKNDFKEIFAE